MSLLLEALKKAEKAKEEAQRRAKGGGDAELQLDPDATVLDPGKHVTTRDELPDISQPMEILSNDLRPAARSTAAPATLALVEEAPPAPRREARRSPSASPAADSQRAERAAAQKVFEAKFKEPNPRLPFLIAVGMLALLGVGTGIYFWIQLRPAPSLINTNPGRPANEKAVEVAAEKPAAASAPAQATSPAAIPGLPTGAASQPASQAASQSPPQPAAAAATPGPPTAPAAAPAAAPARPPVSTARAGATARAKPAARDGERELSVHRAQPQIHPRVGAGYAAYQAGDLAKARSEYQQVLRDDPANRDALLGLAAIEMRAQRYDLSDAYYRRLLQADPRDAHAQAGMLALRSQQLDPLQVESRLKSLIAGDREANVLYFTLGNQYAQQGRWAEAQQAYFKAFAADPENPDFAFNLAVSLDQLHQPRLALEYYRRALTLAEKRAANFAAEVARTRVQQLAR